MATIKRPTTVYTHVGPDGTVYTTKSTKTLTHVVEHQNEHGVWVLVSWHASEKAAMRAGAANPLPRIAVGRIRPAAPDSELPVVGDRVKTNTGATGVITAINHQDNGIIVASGTYDTPVTLKDGRTYTEFDAPLRWVAKV